MAEWALLLVLVPAVVIPIGLLLGFAGCEMILLQGPTVINVRATSPTSIQVGWINDPDADSFRIEMTQLPEATPLPPIDAASSPFEVTGLLAGTTYGIQVIADFVGHTEKSLLLYCTTLSVVFDTIDHSEPTSDQPAQGYCVVQRIEPSRLNASGARVRIILHNPTTNGASIDRMYISQLGPGDPYDSAGDLRRVFDVGTPPDQPPLLVQGATELALPIIDYTLDATRPLLVAFDLTPGFPSVVRFLSLQAPDAVAYFQPGVQEANAAVGNRTPGYASANGTALITRIEAG